MGSLPNTQQASQSSPPKDIAKPYRAYTTKQWMMKEDWYVDQVNSINITASPSPADIQDLAFKIDALLSTARMDYAFVGQAYDRYSMLLKIEERRLFVDLKQTPPTQYANMKLTVDEMKGVVASVLLNQQWDNTGLSLYKLVEQSSARNIFMEGVIKCLQDKKDLLITHSSMMKIEHGLNGMTPNVPGNNQMKGSVPYGD